VVQTFHGNRPWKVVSKTDLKFWGLPLKKFAVGSKLAQISWFSDFIVYFSTTERDITNLKTDYETRDIPLPDSERMVYIGPPWITTKQLILTHYKPNTNNHYFHSQEGTIVGGGIPTRQNSMELIF